MRTAPAPNMVAIPGMNPGTIVAGGGGGAGGGSGGSGKGGKDGKGGDGEDGGDDAEGGGKPKDGGEGCGDPVCPITGKMFLDVMDFAFWATKELKFIRHYTSRRSDVAGSFGFGWTHPFGWQLEERRRAIFVYDDCGDRQKFARPVDGGPASSHPFGWTLARVGDTYRLTRDGGELLTFERHPAAQKFLLRYLSDVRGNTTTVEYDERGRFIGLTDSERRPFRATLDELGRIVRFQVPTEATHQNWMDLGHYRYDEHGDLIEYVDAVGFSWQYRYHNHLMVEHRTGCGLSYLYRYDGDSKEAYCIESWGEYIGRDDPALLVPISEVLKNPDPLAPKPKGINYVKLTYIKEQFMSEVENGLGGITRYFGDSFGRVVKKVDPAGLATERTFDPASGDVSAQTSKSGARAVGITDHSGEICGHVLSDKSGVLTVRPEPFIEEKTYYPSGDKVVTHYDAYGSPIFVKHVDGTFEAYQYDARGLLVSHTDRTGSTLRYVWDEMGNLVEVHYPGGAVVRANFDYLGRCVLHRSRYGEETTFGYDGRSEVIYKRTHDGTEAHATYSAQRRKTHLRIGSRTWQFEYGGLDWLIRETDPSGAVTQFLHDVEGNVVLCRTPRGDEFTFQYDLSRRIVEAKDPEGRVERRSYVASGAVGALETPLGLSTREYDEGGLLIAVETPDDSISLAYDARGNTAIATSHFELEHERDALGRIVVDRQGPHSSRVSWQGGSLEGIVSDVGVPLGFRFAGGILQALTAGATTTEFTFPAERDALCFLGLEVVRHDSYDEMGSLRRTVIARAHRYDSLAGGIAKNPTPEQLVLSVDYEYGELRELVREVRSDGRSVEYELDRAGRIRQKTVVHRGVVTHDERIDYDPAGAAMLSGVRFDGFMRPAELNGETFAYDVDGRLSQRITDRGVWQYEWDYLGNLILVRAPDRRVEMVYDGRGRRVRKTVFTDASTKVREVEYVWSNQTLMHEVDLTTGWTRTYLRQPHAWAPFGHVDSRGAEERAYFYVCDSSGIPDMALDLAGNVVWSAERTVFGDVRIDDGRTIDLDVRFAGQLYDRDIELTYNRMRWYDARTAHYVSPDPTSLDGGVALRRYVANPTAQIDPMGEAGFFPPFGNPASVKNAGTADQFELAKPGPNAQKGTKEIPGFIDCPESELNAGGHTPEDAGSEQYSKKFSKSTSKAIDNAGKEYGCHRCGSKNPNGPDAPQEGEELEKAQKSTHFVPDHVPPAMMHTSRNDKYPSLKTGDIIEAGKPSGVKLLPHCRKCAGEQGRAMAQLRQNHTNEEILDMGRGMISTMQGISPAS